MTNTIQQLKQELEALRSEYAICRCKLDSKCEALLILSKDLDVCRQERDQFKLMAEQVQARYQGLKRQLAGVGPRQISVDGAEYSGMKQQSLAQLLCEMREVNKAQQFEIDSLKQKLADAQGDIKLLREQIARHRVGTTDEGINTRHFPAHEREDLVKQLEEAKEQFLQIERDLQQVLDEKEELVTERDVYRNKYERLNTELNLILRGDQSRLVDIDALTMENKYLQDRIKQIEEEKSMALATVAKYKNILERKKNKGIIRLGQARTGGVVISQKQVQQMLESKCLLTPSPKMVSDLQALATALLESLNDKNMALQHQRKTNKILGSRVAELEKKLKTFEVAGFWNVPDKALSIQKLREEVREIQNLLPDSPSSQHGETLANGMVQCDGHNGNHSHTETGHCPQTLLMDNSEMLKLGESTESADSADNDNHLADNVAHPGKDNVDPAENDGMSDDGNSTADVEEGTDEGHQELDANKLSALLSEVALKVTRKDVTPDPDQGDQKDVEGGQGD